MDIADEISGLSHAVLSDALDSLPQGIVVYDAEDRLLLWNARYAELYALAPGFLNIGLPFETINRTIAFSGRLLEAVGREEAWLAERLAQRHLADCAFEHRLSDGRWIRVEDKRTPEGRNVGIRVDITALKRQEASFRLLFESNPVPILVQDRDTLAFLAVNDAALRLFGYARETFLDLAVGDLCAAGRTARFADGAPWRSVRADGALLDLLPYSSEFIRNGRAALITALVDLTQIRKGEEDLDRTRAFLNSVVETIPSVVFAKDMQDGGRYVLYNQAGVRQTGLARDAVLGHVDREIFEPDLAASMVARDIEVVRSGRIQNYEYHLPMPDGTRRLFEMRKLPIADARGEAARYVLGICDDVTDRRALEHRVALAARFDDLTGLPNRVAFVEMLGKALRGRRKPPDGLALLLIDLDDFRVLNDALGHITGDALLRAVGGRLAAQVRGADRLARLGADEFIIVQTGVAAPADAADLADRLLEELRHPFTLDGQDLRVGASIGVALSTKGQRDPDVLLRHAELALQSAKANRRGGFEMFEPRMEADVRQRRTVEQQLREALDRDEFELFYQPQVDLATECVTGFEALVRWHHPTRGLVEPGDFIGLAEETGLIVPLGAWVLRRACAEAMTWATAVRVAVNLSPVQFITPGLPEAVTAALLESGLPPSRLELEITESVRLIDNDTNLAILHRFREMGIHVALDDFGTGFASLSYLRAFPFSKIKIDRFFVGDLGRDEGCLAIVRAAVRLARDLGIDTIAEGVETSLQFLQLRQLGCGSGQGYLFGRPRPAEEIVPVLAGPMRQAV